MWTDIEQSLVDVLKTALPDVRVLTANDLKDVDEANQPTPAVHVIYNGYRVSESRPDGLISRVSQNWMTVIAVKNLRDRKRGSAARTDAVALAEKIAGALMGEKLPAAAGPLVLATAPAPGASDGFLYVPIAWTADVVLKRPTN